MSLYRKSNCRSSVLGELKNIPSLFCVEGEKAPSRVGYITDILVQEGNVTIKFSFDENIKPLKEGTIEELFFYLNLGRFEIYRTHWAIKEGDLFSILKKKGLIQEIKQKEVESEEAPLPEASPSLEPRNFNNQVFIVHGHDEVVKYEMAGEIKDLGLEPIILHEQASGGRTIIEKIERYSNVGFAVVLKLYGFFLNADSVVIRRI